MTADLPALLAEGERAVFHGSPAAAVPLLERAVAAARADGRGAEGAAAGWLLGAALGAAGRYGPALDVLLPLVEDAQLPDAPAEARLVGALAAATAASVFRALRRRTDAQHLDQEGLRLADQWDDARFDAALGLASDLVGLGDAAAAQARLELPARLVEAHPEWWRQRVRLGWARAEVALLDDDAAEAEEAAAAAVELAERSRAPRHVAKGLLFLGLAQAQGRSPAAVATLRRAAALAEALGALPVAWPARALLGALLAERDPAEAARCRVEARAALHRVADALPPDLRREWLARPDVAELVEIDVNE